jgi:hypothetical protein
MSGRAYAGEARIGAARIASASMHLLASLSLLGLTRQSTLEPALASAVEARIKSGHDKHRNVAFMPLRQAIVKPARANASVSAA